MSDRAPRSSDDPTDRRLRRRTVLAGASVALGNLAGCTGDGSDGSDGGDDESSGDGGGDDGGDSEDGGSDGDRTETNSEGDEDGTPSEDLDLREANVTAVEVASEGGGEYRFSVTLYHDDDGEDGYADRWVVERRDGTEIGRRVLTHAHSTDPFTRSTTLAVPEDVDCVVVRGHDETHGYGGQAAVVVPDSGATAFVRQGSERASFADRDCPA